MRIEGNLIIDKEGGIYIGDRLLIGEDEIILDVKRLRQIISDAKEDII